MSRAAVDARAGRGISVDRIPLAVYRRVRHAGVAAQKCRAKIRGAISAEVDEGQVVEIEVSPSVNRKLSIAAARTYWTAAETRLPILGCSSHNPLKGFAAIL